MFAIIYHNGYAYDYPSEEAVLGPYATREAALVDLGRLAAAQNEGEHGPVFEVDDEGYMGIELEKHPEQDLEELASEVWAEVTELQTLGSLLHSH